jgi:hypothetical protein
MPTPIVTQPIITTAGLIATRDSQGVAVRITHIGLGTASGYEPNKSQTALIAEKLRFPIAYTADVGMNFKQVTIDAIAEQGDPFFYGEIGFFMENGELFAVSSHLGDTAYLSDSISTTLTYSFGLSALPPDSVEFVIDSESAISYKLLEDHVNQYNPHPNSRENLSIDQVILKAGLLPNQSESSQLWNAISLNSFKSNLFVDAGGSTAQVRNLKCANPNTCLPPLVGGDPASNATRNQWVGFCFTMENKTEAAYNNALLTINFKDKNGITVMTTKVHPSISWTPLLGGAWQDCFIASDHTISPRHSFPPFTKVFESGDKSQSVEVSHHRVGGQKLQIFKGIINAESASTTQWNSFTFPVPFASHPTIVCQRIESSSVADGQVTSMMRAAFITVVPSDVAGKGFKYIAFKQNGVRAADPAFCFIAYGYV